MYSLQRKHILKAALITFMAIMTTFAAGQSVNIDKARTVARNIYTESFSTIKDLNVFQISSESIIEDRETTVIYVFNITF